VRNTLISILLLISSKLLGQIPVDKILHFNAGYIISASAGSASYHFNINDSVSIGISAGVLAGFGKEVHDHIVYRGFDPFDFAFTANGSFWGGFTIHTIIQKKPTKKPIQL